MAGRGRGMTLPAWMTTGSAPGANGRAERDRSPSDHRRPTKYDDDDAPPPPRADTHAHTHSHPAPPATSAPASSGGAPAVDTKALIAAAMSRAMSNTAASTSVLRPARRLYVGGLPLPDATEAAITAFFNEVLDRAYMPTGAHVMSVYINAEKRFAFVEFRSPELATAVMALDGLLFMGHALKIKRPNDFNPALALPTVPDGPNKVFIGGLPYALEEPQIKELLQAFGPLRGLHLVRDPSTHMSKGYAFAEWADPAVTDKAVAGLNGLPFGDKQLTVRHANVSGSAAGGPSGVDMASLVAAATAGLAGGMSYGGYAPPPTGSYAAEAAPPAGMSSAAAAPPPAPAASSARPSTSLRLSNMLTMDDLRDDAEYADVVEDVRAELQRYGQLASLDVPRTGPRAGSVYVTYASLPDALAAQQALHNRRFASRSIVVDFE